MNDHRTFLPYIGLVIAVAGSAALLVARFRSTTLDEIAATCAVVLFYAQTATLRSKGTRFGKAKTLGTMSWIKSPRNGRGLMNYATR